MDRGSGCLAALTVTRHWHDVTMTMHSAFGVYQPVDFQSPVVTGWVAAVLLVLSLMVVVHAVWRRRRQVSFAHSTGRNVDPNVIRDARAEQIVGYVLVGVAVVIAGFAGWGAWQTHQAVRANLEQKYGVTAVENDTWNGSNLVADLTQPDGSVLTEQMVYFEPDGEPLTGEDVYQGLPGGEM